MIMMNQVYHAMFVLLSLQAIQYPIMKNAVVMVLDQRRIQNDKSIPSKNENKIIAIEMTFGNWHLFFVFCPFFRWLLRI